MPLVARGRLVVHAKTDAFGLALLLVATAVLYLWRLDVSGLANQYYSAAALSGAQSWKALFFGSLDAAGSITIDKPPLAIWPMALMVKTFGLSSWSVLIPQALEGVTAVAFLYGAVRRSTSSSRAALLAGTIFASTPIAVLMFRYNNPDAMLTMLTVAAAYTTVRSLDSRHAALWLATSGALVGTAFMCKLLQGFMILPSLLLIYALFAAAPIRRRLIHLAIAAIATAVAAGWWILTVELWPASSRPWIGGSTNNSVLQLALGYNGIGRLTGNESSVTSSSGWHGANLPRMLGTPVWTGVMWLMPAALVLATGALWVLRRPSTEVRGFRSGIWLWLSWLVVNSTVFCLMAGIFHSYYTIVLAPAIAALVGIGGLTLWRARHRRHVGHILVLASAVTTLVAIVLQRSHPGQMTGLTLWVWEFGALSMALVLIGVVPVRIGRVIVGVALVGSLMGPMAYSIATAGEPHAGPGPQAGPAQARTNRRPSAAIIRALRDEKSTYDWAAAVSGARTSSSYQLASGRPIIGIGGYKQTDPSPTLVQFRSWVHDRRIHFFIDTDPRGPATAPIRAWVKANFVPEHIGNQTLYDLSKRAS